MDKKTKNKKQRFLLFDGNAIAHRAYHSYPELTTEDGVLINAVYGFLISLFQITNSFPSTHIAVAFDKGKKTFRHKIYKPYKGNRQSVDSDSLYPQLIIIRDILDVLNITHIDSDEVEADDIIGILSGKACGCNMNSLVVTCDHDLLQLVDKNVNVLLFRSGKERNIIFNKKLVKEKYGLPPEKLIDLKAIMGDSSDNIRGVDGIGEKGATYLIKKYGCVEMVYDNIDKIEDKYKKKLDGSREDALLSKKLVTILKTHGDIDYHIDNFKNKDYDREQAQEYLKSMGFKSIINKI